MVSIFMVLSAIAVCASEKSKDYNYYYRGVFVSIDFVPGLVINDKTSSRESNSSVGTDIAIGYRFMPQFVLAIGTGAHSYSNKTLTCGDTVRRKIENTCIPVFLRLRSDFLDREVTPYIQMDFGYSFMDMYARDELGRVKYSEERFTNGRFEYVEMNDSYIQYGNAGYYSELDIGISLHIIGRARMNIALCGGVHQAFLGTAFRIDDGEVLNFGRIDHLNTSDNQEPILVRTVGCDDFNDTFEPFVRVRISFIF